MSSYEHIRTYYGVPAKRFAQVWPSPEADSLPSAMLLPGTTLRITGTSGPHLRITARRTDPPWSCKYIVHPDDLVYENPEAC